MCSILPKYEFISTYCRQCYVVFVIITVRSWYTVAQVVEALYYKRDVRGFNSQ